MPMTPMWKDHPAFCSVWRGGVAAARMSPRPGIMSICTEVAHHQLARGNNLRVDSYDVCVNDDNVML